MLYQRDIYKQLEQKKALVLGDFILDVYTKGLVRRISPEAPVPVLNVTNEYSLPGGAGNTILNLISLGMHVTAVGRIGPDSDGRAFFDEISKEEVDTRGIFTDLGFATPRKNRIMAESQQIVRIDHESPTPLSAKMEEQVIDALPSLLEGMDVVAISDYAKGFLTPTVLRALIDLAQVPVIVDPKGMDFTRYSGATIIKPNLSEAVAAAGLGVEATLDEIAEVILEETSIDSLIVTRSKEGISIFRRNCDRSDYPAIVHEVRDVTGAGDTVLALVTASVANGLCHSEMAHLSNVAASIAIERVGCARVTLDDLAKRLYNCASFKS